VLTGTYGCGKTHLLQQLAISGMQLGEEVIFQVVSLTCWII